MKKRIKIALLNDHHVYRKGVVSLFKEYSDFEMLLDTSSLDELLSKILDNHPDVIILDYRMRFLSVFEAIRLIKTKNPHLKVLVLSMCDDLDIVSVLVDNGMDGFLNKNADFKNVIIAINTIMNGKYYFCGHIPKSEIKGLLGSKNTAEISTFTKREIEIIRLLCQQLTNKEIAKKLFLSQRTVDGHRAKILMKTKAKNIIGVIMHAIKFDLI